MKEFSPSDFNYLAKTNSNLWELLVGIEITHKNWGKCKIFDINIRSGFLVINQTIVRFEKFNDDNFSNFFLSDIVVEHLQKLRIDEASSHIHEPSWDNNQLYIDNVEYPPIITPEENRKRVEEIKKFCKEKQIINLLHFSKVKNLSSIFEIGLISRVEANRLGIDIEANDFRRTDYRPNATCLSISFPNYKMFYRLNNKNQDEWVVLVLPSSILWTHDCAFCYDNAASAEVSRIPIYKRKEVSSLIGMYSDKYHISRYMLRIPINYPTKPQAEVLVFDRIKPQLVKNVHFKSFNALKEFRSRNSFPNWTKISISDEYFSPRCDYEFWRNEQFLVS